MIFRNHDTGMILIISENVDDPTDSVLWLVEPDYKVRIITHLVTSEADAIGEALKKILGDEK